VAHKKRVISGFYDTATELTGHSTKRWNCVVHFRAFSSALGFEHSHFKHVGHIIARHIYCRWCVVDGHLWPSIIITPVTVPTSSDTMPSHFKLLPSKIKYVKTWLIIAVIHTTLAVVKLKPENNSDLNGIRSHHLFSGSTPPTEQSSDMGAIHIVSS